MKGHQSNPGDLMWPVLIVGASLDVGLGKMLAALGGSRQNVSQLQLLIGQHWTQVLQGFAIAKKKDTTVMPESQSPAMYD